MKKYTPVLLIVLVLMSCNLPSQGFLAFIAPEGNATPTPNWAATLQAAVPVTETPTPTISLNPTETPQATAPGEGEPPPLESPTPKPLSDNTPILYYTQAGDTVDAIAFRFDVSIDEIASPEPIPIQGFINPNQLLIIPDRLGNTTSNSQLLPDSELVYTLSAIDFDANEYANQAGGYLSEYSDYLGSIGQSSGADVIAKIALENSINPRILLALLEYQSGWVTSFPNNSTAEDYPFGYIDANEKGLLNQVKWAVNQLSYGYYGWREGRLREIKFSDGATTRLQPDLNAGTVALLYYFAQLNNSQEWLQITNPEVGFSAVYEQMFGSPWVRANSVEPLFPPGIRQPNMELPFMYNQLWSYTGGPHGAWERDGSWAAVDFSPARTQSGCVESTTYVTASAAGLVVRSGNGVVVVDLDGDGFEQTGWAVVYLHIETKDRVKLGNWVETGDFIGHPSCEGGQATGTHVHMARKYNGEWIAADGAIPLVLTGWRAHSGSAPYKGTLTRDGETVTASTVGAFTSRITRDRYEGSQ
jgi:murein DD-endopeptidase MepM/ murein hydrolase activator NlpD